MSLYKLILKNLTRHKLRSFLLVLCIFVAFIVYGVLKTFERAMNAGIEFSAANRLVTVNKINFTQTMPYAYYNKVKSLEGVKAVTFSRWFGGYYQEPKNFIVALGIEPNSFFDVYSEMIVDLKDKDAFLKDRRALMVGRTLADKNGWKVGDRIPLSSSIFFNKNGGHTWDFTIRAIFDGDKPQVDTNFAVFHYEYFDLSITFGAGTIGWMVLLTEDPSMNEIISKKIDDMFANSSFETRTTTESAFNKAFIEQIGNISLIIQSVVSVAFLTILMIVGNTMFLAVRERIKEIAILKTIGFNQQKILAIVMGESLLLTLCGGIPALFGVYIVVKLLNYALGGFLPGLFVPTQVIINSIGWMIVLSFVTAIIPAYNAMRLNIITALGRVQ